MSFFTSVLFFIMVVLDWSSTVSQDPDLVTERTDLLYVFLIHRHGERTPIPNSMKYLARDDQVKVKELIKPWGYGQLTDAGKRTGYKTGQFIRRRYDGFISPRFNGSEVYIRSTDSGRTKMTLLTALSALFPPQKDSWSEVINWEPVPYTTVPLKLDFNEAIVNCPAFIKRYHAKINAPNSRMDPYAKMIMKLSDIIGVNIIRTPVAARFVYDVYVSVTSLGYTISNDLKQLMPELEKAAGVAWDISIGDEANLALVAGVTLKEFFNYAEQIIAGTDTQKMRIYSAHDVNVYAFEAISRLIPRQGAPKYGSLIALELRKVVATGQYVVLPVYLPDPHDSKVIYLRVEGCGDQLCDFYTFGNLTSSFLRDEDTWRTECGFSPDLVFDTSSVD